VKGLVARALLVIASLGVAALLGEWIVRASYKDDIVMFPRYHTDYRYGEYRLRGIRPNAQFRHRSVDGSWSFVTNSRGLRDARDFAYEKPAGVLRVLALGDSHTQGYEVRQEATYAAVLERYLARHGRRAEVLNAGVSGFGTAEALAFLENEGYRYQPDVVVLGFYANDFEDNRRAALFGLNGDRLRAVKRSYLPGVRIQNVIYALPGVAWLSENSYAYSLAFNGVWLSVKMAMRARARDAAARAELAQFESAVARKASYPPEDVALAAALIERMRRFCGAITARFIVVDIPRPGARYELVESLSAGLIKQVELVSSRDLLDEFDGAVELHVPHGHRHISEFTHALIAVELGRRILGR
jgi:lysophospholipase L1-like esterase